MTFSTMSNAACNSNWLRVATIPPMHASMERLYAVIGRLRGMEGQTRLADALNESPQTVNNWESRGISAIGAIKAQREFGCNAAWILSGEGAVMIGLPLSADVCDRIAGLDPDQLRHLENVVRAHLGMPVLNPDAPPPPPRFVPTQANQNVASFAKRKSH